MKTKILFICLILFISCKEKIEKLAGQNKNEIYKTESPNKTILKFDFEKFRISRGQVGKIKVGMNIKDAEILLNQLSKKEVEAYDFGFDGGGKAYLYSLGGESVIALIPKRDTEEILAIIALSAKLKTGNSLHPKSTVGEIQQKYTGIKMNQNLMMGWEFMNDEKNNLDFVFMTSENNQIGEYHELEIPVNPKRTNVKTDWITVK